MQRLRFATASLTGLKFRRCPEFADHKIVDRATSYVGGTATLFVYDDSSQQFVRRTTNLKKENGDRAVGTQLAADHPAQAVLARGQAFKGPAILFGRRFYTAYQPVFDAGGKVIGIRVRRHSDGAARQHAVAGARGPWRSPRPSPLCWCSGMTMLIVRRVTKPLRAVTESLTGIAEGRTDVEIRHSIATTKSARLRGPSTFSGTTASSAANSKPSASSAEKLAMDKRKAELSQFVEDFRTKIGGIIEQVLKSSGQFEKDAQQLSVTARSTAEMSGQSANASRQASEHVRTAAAASNELSQSIVEISRRVQESNGVAAEAVKQASSHR